MVCMLKCLKGSTRMSATTLKCVKTIGVMDGRKSGVEGVLEGGSVEATVWPHQWTSIW